jgi:hypothetical protein
LVRRRIVSFVFFVLVLLCVSTACSSPTYTRLAAADIEGVWLSSGPEGRTGKLEFRIDGTFQGAGLPDVMFDTAKPYAAQPDWTSLKAIEGTWETTWDEGAQQPFVKTNTDRLHGMRLLVEGAKDRLELKYYVGDPDSGEFIGFKKQR